MRFIAACVAVLMASPVIVAAQTPAPKYTSSAFTLSPVPYTWTKASELQCGVLNDGRICDSHTAGFWPAGTPNNHVFEFGPQITAIIQRAPTCTDDQRPTAGTPGCFPWAGDTTGAFFSNSSFRVHRTPVHGVFDSRPLNDADDWPVSAGIPGYPFASALIADTSVFHASLIGRQHVAEHDTWTAYSDGLNVGTTPGRASPLGLLVEQRTLTWRYPEGNEATIYVVYRVTNATHTAAFQAAAETDLFAGGDRLPDEGWRLDSIYFSLYADFDVGQNYAQNHLTASLPFDMLIGYQAPFTDPLFEFPPQHYHAPFFANATSIVGLQYLKTPGAHGATGVTAYTGGGAFPLPAQMPRAWRSAALRPDPEQGDPVCTFPGDNRERGFCWLGQTTSDVRGTITTGSFSLAPGESETVVVALNTAATVATPRITVGSIVANPPGWPAAAPGCGADTIRAIEEGAGWVASNACPVSGRTDPMQVTTVPKSLFNRAQIARAIVANRFVMPAAPEAPPFELIAGRDSIIVRWQPSVTETAGDPYHAIAADENSVLHDPSYRRNDVEGYRIWRGTRPDDLQLIAQFDYANTAFEDRLCRTVPQHVTWEPCDAPPTRSLSQPLVQYFTARLENGDVVALRTDTALAAAIAAGRAVPLRDSGVPFELVDTDVEPGVTYHYAVTAFDINSVRSAPSSLESARVVRPARITGAGLRRIHTVPDPYYGSSDFDVSGAQRRIRFVNMPPRATIRIYTISGVLVDVLVHDDASGATDLVWDLRGRGNHRVRSGVYFFHVSTPDGRQHTGRFTLVMPNGG